MRVRRRWKVAAVQLTSTAEVERNVRGAVRRIRQAAAEGADLVALPENFAYLRPEGSKVTFRTGLRDGLVSGMRDLAGELEIHLLLGSIPEAIPRSRKIHNTSVLIGPDGAVLAVYRKMHLFDIAIHGKVNLKESSHVEAGTKVVVASTELGNLGLSVCYDLRFPELYRKLAFSGAQVLFVPAAFTSYTGPYHWLPLLRARAIENQCWVVAPAQVGNHGPGRRSHGETAVVDPWGEVVACRPKRPGPVHAEIDLDRVARVRQGLPCLDHVRLGGLGARSRKGTVRGEGSE
jgi:predicted amidohydrolase